MTAIGLLGGTFNPPHLGHLVCASEAAAQLRLDRVLLVPVAEPPHKEAVDDPGAQERLELCLLAVAGDERLDVSRIEVDRGGPSYTVDTLRALHEREPENELTFIVGGDQALGLPGWREPGAVLDLARLAVVERSGATRRDVVLRLADFLDAERGRLCDADDPGSLPGVAFVDMPRVDISSTEVRRRVAGGRPIRYLVGDAVAQRIAERGLYR